MKLAQRLSCLITPLYLAVLSPSVMWQESASGHLLSWGQKSAVNCAQSSYSGWVTSRSRQRAGIGDLLSSPGITFKQYTDWSHNKLNAPLHLRHTHTHQKGPSDREQLVKGHFTSSVYFPSLNCVITNGSVGKDASDWMHWPSSYCGKKKKTCMQVKSVESNPSLFYNIFPPIWVV